MIEKTEFGMTDGYKVFLFTLKNSKGMTVKLTNYSGAIVSIFVPDKDGNFEDVVLGYDDLEGYVNGTSSQGALVGRYANRIADAKFTLNGKEINLRANEGTNCLHGGIIGYNKKMLDFYKNTEPGRFEIIEGIDTLRFLDYGKQLKLSLVPSCHSLSVDTEKDLEEVRRMMKENTNG